VIFPKVYWEFCRDEVMVQEFAAGTVSLTDKAAVEALGVPFNIAVNELAELFGETAFVHGYMHNDLHPGNVLVRPQGTTSSRFSPRACRVAIHTVLASCYLAVVAAVLLCCAVFLRQWQFLSLLTTVCTALAIALGNLLVKGRAREAPMAALLLAAQAWGGHLRLASKLQSLVARATQSRFDLIIIDHGFHTHLPYEFRQTWCKVWVALGLADEDLLREAAAELGLEGDTYKALPLVLCFTPYPFWKKREYPQPADFQRLVNDSEVGFPAIKRADKQVPPLWHLVIRVNYQVGALFQMQYGLSPACRHEFMRFMTRSALLGMRFEHRPAGTLPVPGRLCTAAGDFFDRELSSVEARLWAEFHWKQNLQSETPAPAAESDASKDVIAESASPAGHAD